jgi:Peptidoglycan-synthase activator LpoB
LPFQTQPVFLDGRISETPRVEKGSDHLLTQIFTERLRETRSYQIVAQDQVEAAMAALKKAAEGGFEVITASFAQKVGKALGADVVITGEVGAFIERKGGSRAIERPATVGFVVQMINVKDGRLLWSSHYYETQKYLSEDLNTLPLFLKRRGKWLTAQELAEYGANEMIKTLPKVKG